MDRHPDHLERALADLGERLAWPPEADLAPAVRARLEEKRRAPARGRWVQSLAVAAGLVLVVAGILALSPAARQAVADLLGVGGVRITTGVPVAEPPGASLELGEAVTLEEAVDRVAFPVLVPGDLGPPAAVFLREPPEGGQVSLVWEPRPGLPAAPGTGVGLLLTQFPASLEPVLEKAVGPETDLEAVTVRGERGFWVEGAPHLLYHLDRDGEVIEEEVRLAANVLVWEEAGVTYRIETTLGKEKVLGIAGSLEPVE